MGDNELISICLEAIEKNPKAVEDFSKGKDKAVQAMIGFVMKSTKGRADAAIVREILLKELKK